MIGHKYGQRKKSGHPGGIDIGNFEMIGRSGLNGLNDKVWLPGFEEGWSGMEENGERIPLNGVWQKIMNISVRKRYEKEGPSFAL